MQPEEKGSLDAGTGGSSEGQKTQTLGSGSLMEKGSEEVVTIVKSDLAKDFDRKKSYVDYNESSVSYE